MAFYIILAGRWLSSQSSNLICLCFSACLCFCGTYGVLSSLESCGKHGCFDGTGVSDLRTNRKSKRAFPSSGGSLDLPPARPYCTTDEGSREARICSVKQSCRES
ncbi:hypothetical protein BDV30DRAFT_210979 [Aspergillus minisclerotigenes]|uniref:Uncharacterized protein n=1 Tax=Aspergillus minisclerotigenes TaxID=656917 RepID=A0A5N6J2T0_9EURO|nr:hypothetical protein BDV30DRAFT_210979 [Aspergillus minisclerotigenes]